MKCSKPIFIKGDYDVRYAKGEAHVYCKGEDIAEFDTTDAAIEYVRTVVMLERERTNANRKISV